MLLVINETYAFLIIDIGLLYRIDTSTYVKVTLSKDIEKLKNLKVNNNKMIQTSFKWSDIKVSFCSYVCTLTSSVVNVWEFAALFGNPDLVILLDSV